jgi:hypothetical protein
MSRRRQKLLAIRPAAFLRRSLPGLSAQGEPTWYGISTVRTPAQQFDFFVVLSMRPNHSLLLLSRSSSTRWTAEVRSGGCRTSWVFSTHTGNR